jgi:hypothetical protein
MASPPPTGPAPTDESTLLAAVNAVLASPPLPPRDPSMFTSGTLFGEPGTYPQGSPMAPADRPSDAPTVASELDAVASALDRRAPGTGDRVRRIWSDPRVAGTVTPPVARAALAVLAGTVAAPAVTAFVEGGLPVLRLGLGPTASPGRVVGPRPSDDRGGEGTERVVNERYAGEHPATVAPSIAHDLLWSGPGAGHDEEATLHLLVAAVHLQLVAASPGLAHLGTELTRRQNALALTLLNSRRPGSAQISAVAPDGPGTIPGGAPGMQTPDFWSIPFAAPSPEPVGPDEATEPVVAAIVAPFLGGSAAVDRPVRYDAALAGRLRSTGAWLPPDAALRAAVALGALDAGSVLGTVKAATGRSVPDLVDALGLAEAAGCWAGHP